MSLSFLNKLIRLTNGNIDGDDSSTAREIRDRLVNDVFSLLLATEKAEVADVTEFNDMVRVVKREYGPDRTEAEFAQLARILIGVMRVRESEISQRNVPPDPYVQKLVLLMNGNIQAVSGDQAYEARMDLVKQVFPELLEVDQIKAFNVSEFDDVYRELEKIFNGASYHMLKMMTRQAVQQLRSERWQVERAKNPPLLLPPPATPDSPEPL